MTHKIDKSRLYDEISEDIVDKLIQLSDRPNAGFPKDYTVIIDKDLYYWLLQEKEFGFLDYFDVEIHEFITTADNDGCKPYSVKITSELMDEDIILEGYTTGDKYE